MFLLRKLSSVVRQQYLGALALFIALGGSAYAAATIGPADIKDNAVHSNHIADGQVKNPDLAPNSIGTGKVADGSLLAQDFKAGQLPKGDRGPAGPGAITYDDTVGEFGGTFIEKTVNGITLEIRCTPEGVAFTIDDEQLYDGAGGSGLGVVGTKQVNFGAPSGVHTGGSYVDFPASTAVDLDVMAQNNHVGKWTEFKLYSLHRAADHKCSYGGIITPS
jgi:hypothetical protein